MPTLSIRFVGGHYHATPWNKAQNEGEVEWPPSPWRILRALIATGYAKLADWQNGIIPDSAKTLLEKLVSVMPTYRLPDAKGAHTRHFMPIKGKTTLVLDARAVMGVCHEPLLIHWNIDLEPQEKEILGELAVRLNYLGRAESWTECELVEDIPMSVNWVQPCGSVSSVTLGFGWEQIALTAPIPAQEYSAWRSSAYVKNFGNKRPNTAQLKKFDGLYPEDIIACLQVETGWLQAKGWSQPPGSRIVLYWRPTHKAIDVNAPISVQPHSHKPIPFVLLALAANARSRSPLPLVARTLPQAELLHRTIASFVGKIGCVQTAAELLGLDAELKPLIGHHHAHVLPLCLHKKDKRIDHILIWAPGGLSDSSLNILHHIRATYMKGGVGKLSVRFAGGGMAEDLKKIIELQPILNESKVWQSLTPLVLPRYRKKNGNNSPNGQIISELASRNYPVPESIEWLKEESIGLRHYIRTRRNGKPSPENYGYALRLSFAEPVTGPLCLGYASHYGLGLFAAVEPNQYK